MDDIKAEFSGTKKYIEERLEEECSKENISMDEVIFLFTYQEANSQHRKNTFYFVMLGFKAGMFSLELHLAMNVNRYSSELNPLSHDIYLRVIWI